jgi:hypothetical protein
VKYRIGAAIAAIAFTLLPGALLAGSASETVLAKDFDADTHTVTGVTSKSDVHKLRHTAATVHEFIVDPALFPPGPSRTFATEWNLAVFQNKSASRFDRLLHRASELGVALRIERTDKANADGAFELVKVVPER